MLLLAEILYTLLKDDTQLSQSRTKVNLNVAIRWRWLEQLEEVNSLIMVLVAVISLNSKTVALFFTVHNCYRTLGQQRFSASPLRHLMNTPRSKRPTNISYTDIQQVTHIHTHRVLSNAQWMHRPFAVQSGPTQISSVKQNIYRMYIVTKARWILNMTLNDVVTIQ